MEPTELNYRALSVAMSLKHRSLRFEHCHLSMASFGDDVPVRFEEFEFETLLKDDTLTRNMVQFQSQMHAMVTLTRNMVQFQSQMHAMVEQWYMLEGQIEDLRAENVRLSDALDKAISALSLSRATNAHARHSNVESMGAIEHGCINVGLGNSDDRDVRCPTADPGSPQGMAQSSDSDVEDTYGSYGVCFRCGMERWMPNYLDVRECEECLHED